jgi:hypothetical protein
MNFENDIFVSYAHIDDQALVEGQKGWISSFHRVLEIRLGQLLGRPPRIWRDPKLQGNDIFADRLVDRLPRVAILASIVSPRYVKSEWCMRELREFWKASTATAGMRVGTKARVFKIVKTPVPLDQQISEFQDVLGYEFYAVDPDSGRARELSQTGDAEAQRLYWAKLDDLAHDMAELLEVMEKGSDEAPVAVEGSQERVTVYLAETSFDLREQRDAVRREFQGYDAVVLPDRPLPLVGPECEEVVREQLARSSLSIHLIGRNYGLVPEGETRSTVVLQNDLAIERGAAGDFGRLIWLPEDLESEDERQVRFIDSLQTDPRIQEGADILQTTLGDFKSAIHRRLRPPEQPAEEPAAVQKAAVTSDESPLKRIYLIFDQRDGDEPNIVTDYLFDQGFEVILPVFDGEEAQVRRDHEENLSICDGVLLYYGAGNELWLRAKLREVQKSAAFGRKKPITAKAVLLAPPETPSKGRFRTHEAQVVDQRGTFAPAAMQPFLSQLQAG